MNQPTLLGKLLSPAGFGLVLVLFFLPFVAVSCGPADRQVTATFTGLNMVTGTAPTYSGPQLHPEDQDNVSALFEDQYTTEPLAILAAGVAFVAMGTVFIPAWRTRHTVRVVLAGLGAALLLAAELRSIDRLNHIQLRGDDGKVTDISPVNVSPQIGFYLAMAVLLGLAIAHAVARFRGPPGDVLAEGPSGGSFAPGAVPLAQGSALGPPGYRPYTGVPPFEAGGAPPIWSGSDDPTRPDAVDEWPEAWPGGPNDPTMPS
jgi:hypothetical protein